MKKELYIPLLVLLLTIAFGTVCFLMFFFNNSKSLTNWKMKLGGLLLMLSAVVSKGYGQYFEDPEFTCYIGPPAEDKPNRIIAIGTNLGVSFTRFQNKTDNHLPFNISEKFFDVSISPRIEFDFSLNRYKAFYNQFIYSSLGADIHQPTRNFTITDTSFIQSIIKGKSDELELTQDVNYTNISAEFGYKYFLRRFYFSAGIQSSILCSNYLIYNFEIKNGSTDAVFKQDLVGYDFVDNKHIKSKTYKLDLNTFRFSLPLTLGYSASFNYSTSISWYLGFNIPITNSIKNEESKFIEIKFGVGLLYYTHIKSF